MKSSSVLSQILLFIYHHETSAFRLSPKEILLFDFACRVCKGEFIVEAEIKCGVLESKYA